MKNLTPATCAQVTNGHLCGAESERHKEVTAVVSDSRKVIPGCLFVALRGERTDGHRYLAQAAEAGAAAILSEEAPEDFPIPVILVDDSAKALQPLAAFYREQLGTRVIGIVGSVGKTSTKEMVAAVLEQKVRVCKTEGNFNNELGVPFTIFRLTEEDEAAVIEMGINHFGEMDRLGRMVQPDIVVMTNIGTAHLEFLGSREGILQAKSEVLAHLRPGGTVILNGDDDLLRSISLIQGKAPIRFGLRRQNADLWAEEIDAEDLFHTDFLLCMEQNRLPVQVHSPGIHTVYNALAAAAVGRLFAMPEEEIVRGIGTYSGLEGRMRILQAGSLTILDDAYNASPASIKAALSVLQKASGRTVAILGDMGELGEDSLRLHREVGKEVAQCGIDVLYAIGTQAIEYLNGAQEKGSVLCGQEAFFTKELFLQELPQRIRKGDTILVKASHFMGFATIVDALRQYGERENEAEEGPKS